MSGLGVVDVNANITINTDTGAIMGPAALMRPAMTGVVNGVGFHVVTQTSGPGVGVFSVAGLTVADRRQGHHRRRQRVRAGVGGRGDASTASSTLRAAPCPASWPAPAASPAARSSLDGGGPGAGKAGRGGGDGSPSSGGGGAGYGDNGGSGGLVAGDDAERRRRPGAT